MTKHDLVIAELQERINGYQEETRKVVATLEAQIKMVEKRRFMTQRSEWLLKKAEAGNTYITSRKADTVWADYEAAVAAGEVELYMLHEWASDKYIAEGFEISRKIASMRYVENHGRHLLVTFADGQDEYVDTSTYVYIFKVPVVENEQAQG